MWHKFSDEAERFLEGDTPHHVHNVLAVAFRNLLHCVDLHLKVLLFLARGSVWEEKAIEIWVSDSRLVSYIPFSNLIATGSIVFCLNTEASLGFRLCPQIVPLNTRPNSPSPS